MRYLLPLLMAVTAVTAAHAQVQERKLSERIMKPDYTMSFDPGKGSPVANRSIKTRGATSKEFATSQFSAKEFAARDYAGSKPAYFGKSKVVTPDANTKGKFEIPNSDKQAPTKTMEVASARDANKTVETREANGAGRSFLGRGRSQDRFDKEKNGVPESNKPVGYSGELKTLTIDDIRELLNKNK